MGVPKFFRYISERYPCLSELVKEYQIPEFDNLYLDMNGIIHMCSHPDDGNPHFRITEEKIFKDIFHYIEVLFRMICPQKLFFMAIDGVAPRAKMNQQRGRRFRSAKDAEKQISEAIKRGEILPEEDRFDSNCITPGTVFMARLHEQLKYFIVDKISSDHLWQQCKVILSGQETPGEGEHKIMDYIRYMRAQPGYDPNTRHCLYGLDADLIMLGLCTHEPHFSLLREEVKFGRKCTKKMNVPEEITFYLLHLSLMREYLEFEFLPLKDKLAGFKYDFEKIIDDWILMGFLVGNDFIPNLPNLHIVNGALPVLYKAYINILPSLDGYINEAGTLNLQRFEKFMEELSKLDIENFAEIRDDLLYMEAKTGRKFSAHPKVSSQVNANHLEKSEDEAIEPPEQKKTYRDSGLLALLKEVEELDTESDNEETDYLSEEDEAFSNYKMEYYMNKLEYSKVTPEVMKAQAEGYVRAIQWNLNYYYNGCCSWSWYYPHHYAPYISDIKGFSDMKIEFELDQPFLPYEQLLAVLPPASRNLLPSCYHDLMIGKNSLIKKYYPEEFLTDLNGKRQEWEAVVLVPFIDEKTLLEAMSYCNDNLTEEEKKRNSHGPMLIYTYTPKDNGIYPAPAYFRQVPINHTELSTMLYTDILLPTSKLVKGAYPGVKMDVYYPGFPTFKHLKYKCELKNARVKVFEQPSRNENMIVSIIPDEELGYEMIPVDLLGKTVFVNWPHLVEAKIVAFSNTKRKYVSMGGPNQYNIEDKTNFVQELQGITEIYQKRMGIDVGTTKVLAHVQVMTGRRYMFTPNGRLTLEKQFTPNVSNYPLQSVVSNICAHDSYGTVFRDIDEIFPKNSICFTLTNPYYGSQGVVQDNSSCVTTGRIKISISVLGEPNLTLAKELYLKATRSYRTLSAISSSFAISNGLFSRITGSIFLIVPSNENNPKTVNIGLDLKLYKKNKETPGYTKKIANTWSYTEKTGELVKEYCNRFPQVIEYLCNNSSFNDVIVENVFGEDWEDKLKELQSWLKSTPTHSIERQTCGTTILESEIVKEIEKIVDNCKSNIGKKITMQIKPSFLYKPDIQTGNIPPDAKADVHLLDRIVNIRQSFSVPFGLKGTVIGIHQSPNGKIDTMYDVVFDRSFKDGMVLNCSEGRGYRLPITSFINISHGQRLMIAKTGKPDDIICKAEASYHYRYNPNHDYPRNYIQANQQPSLQYPWTPPQNQQYTSKASHFTQSNSAFAQFPTNKPYSNQQNNHSSQIYVTPYNAYNQSQPQYQQPLPQYQPPPYPPSLYHNQQRNCGTQQDNYNQNQQGSYGFNKFNNFMQNFANKAQQSSQNEEPSKKPSKKNREPEPVVPKKEVREPPRVDVSKVDEILKNLLKISDEGSGKQPTEIRKTPPTKETSHTENPSVSFDMFAQVANSPASVRLLTYFQSNGLGLPRYQYFSSNGLIRAQICIDGQLIIGKPASMKNEASENVAKDVLEVLMKKTKPMKNERLHNGIKQSSKAQNKSKKSVDNNQEESNSTRASSAKKQTKQSPQKTRSPVTVNSIKMERIERVSQKEEKLGSHKKNTQKKNATETSVLNNSFVPLQAVKSHIHKTNNKHLVKGSKENVGERENVQAVSLKSNNFEKIGNASKVSNKPKKERKMRIAANFGRKD